MSERLANALKWDYTKAAEVLADVRTRTVETTSIYAHLNKKYGWRRFRTPAEKLRVRLLSRHAMVFRRNGIAPIASALELLGCTLLQFELYIERQFQPRMCWDQFDKLHIDHIRPCAAFDLTDPAQQRLCFHFSNMQPLWIRQNLRKSDKVDGVSARVRRKAQQSLVSATK